MKIMRITKLILLLSSLPILTFAQSKPEMVLVNGGTFQMGRNYEVIGKNGANIAFDDEVPVHKVTVSDFYMAKTETTVAQYKEFVAKNSDGVKMPLSPDELDLGMEIIDPKTKQKRPKTWYDEHEGVSKWQWKPNNPITNVTWKEALLYCNWLSKAENLPPAYKFKKVEIGDGITEEKIVLLDANGAETNDIRKVKGYRLPTEAEWEYAARGGNKSKGYKYAGSNNSGEVAWTDETTYGKSPQAVGLLKPNELGIYDMSGNAWEWCWDNYKKDYYKTSKNVTNPLGVERSLFRSIRGGGWYYMAFLARSVVRDGPRFTYTNYNYGFRIVRSK